MEEGTTDWNSRTELRERLERDRLIARYQLELVYVFLNLLHKVMRHYRRLYYEHLTDLVCGAADEANKELMIGILGLGAIFVQMNELMII